MQVISYSYAKNFLWFWYQDFAENRRFLGMLAVQISPRTSRNNYELRNSPNSLFRIAASDM